MEEKLDYNVIWSLRALAQESEAQRELYPSFAVVADELVLDFDEAYSKYKKAHHTKHVDLEDLDALIASKSGILQYWTDEALENSEFWNEIRAKAQRVLQARSLATSSPHPSPDTFVSGREVWKAGRSEEIPVDDTQKSFLSRLLNRFR